VIGHDDRAMIAAIAFVPETLSAIKMGLSAAERNRRKRERKKREKEEGRKQQEASKEAKAETNEEEPEVEIEYVSEPVLPPTVEKQAPSSNIPDGLPPGMSENQEEKEESESMESVLRRFHQRAAVASAAVVSDDAEEPKSSQDKTGTLLSDEDGDYDEEDKKPMSKRKLRELTRPSVAELKRRVKRPDLVQAHDVTSTDPDFLIHLKSIEGTVSVPRHWGRKRKYLQGKRGFEKPPFKLPDFIIKTGITAIRDTVAEDEAKQSAKQKNRSRVAPKMGAMDVDYKTLHEAFFKYQTKPTDLTKFGDLYYEGKELETSTDRNPGGPFSKALREALGMVAITSPPPWLINMQRYGPPPSYPNLPIPGLNAPLPNDQCQYGYHTGGWGKS
jgi:splicing factor 3B subunit 2